LKYCEKRIEDIKPAFLYVRYPCGDPCYYKFVKKYGNIIISEHQTIEHLELEVESKRFKGLLEKYYGKKILKRIKAIVAVTEEIGNYQLKRAGKDKPMHVLGNGIDPDTIEFSEKQPEFTNELNLLIVANINIWHGIDRVIKGIAEYKGDIKVNFHIVGGGQLIGELKELSKDLNVTEQVIFHGPLKGQELENIYDICHVGISSLGIHRIGLKEGAVLKSREYCAKGMPFVYSFKDPDFKDVPFALRIKQEEKAVKIEEVVNFYKNFQTMKENNLEIRDYAIEFLSWENKIKKLLGLLINKNLEKQK
jgi:glycosyltransferase involved in cell wall biosynthesis